MQHLLFKKNGTSVATFTSNASGNATANITVPTTFDDLSDGTTNKAYTATEKNKLSGIASGAEVNVQSDWNQTNTGSDDYIKNKPTKLSQFTNDVVNNATLTIQKNGTSVATFTSNASGNATANITVPTTLDDLSDGTTRKLANYLPLAGGIMTGAVKRSYNTASDDPVINVTSSNQDIWLWRVSDITYPYYTSGAYGFGLKYLGTGEGNNNTLALFADNQRRTQVKAVEMKQDGTIDFKTAITKEGNIIWHAGNDGLGSGLDADLLDGMHASEFASSSHTHPIIEKTWSQLKAMRDGGTLVPGQQYHITDYTCTTTQADTSTAGHVFDIIVVADTASKLNENARAVAHSGDTYFQYSKLEAWELKYCIDNDADRFAWADSTTGKGVVYYMKDEWNNECPYDFKNILYVFKQGMLLSRYSGFAQAFYERDTTSDTIINNVQYYGWVKTKDIKYGTYLTSNVLTDTLETPDKIYNTSGNLESSYAIESYSPESFNTFTFDHNGNDATIDGLNEDVYSNIIKEYIYPNGSDGKQVLNIIYFRSTVTQVLGANRNIFKPNCYSINFKEGCSRNTFGNNCHDIIFGDSCFVNTFEDACYSNTFGYSCSLNTFKSSCTDNIFGNICQSNTLGNNCISNIFGNNCEYNIFSGYCTDNTFGNSCKNNVFNTGCSFNNFGYGCSSNIFGNSCAYITFGTNCIYNIFGNALINSTFGNFCQFNTCGNSCGFITFGNNCASNTIGSSCQRIIFGDSSSAKSYYQYIIVENGNQYIYLNTTQTASSSNKIRNIKIAQGVNNTTTYKTISHNTVNDTFQTVYQPTNSVIVSV